MSRIFRKASLDRLSSPEQLDQVMRVTSPTGWIALLALLALLLFIVLWGVFGMIPTKVYGEGLLMKGESVININSPGSGQIDKIHIKEGQLVKKGDTVGLIKRPQLQEQIKITRQRLEDLLKERRLDKTMEDRNMQLLAAASLAKREGYLKHIEQAREKNNEIDKRIAIDEALLEKGLITTHELLDRRDEKLNVQNTIMQLQGQIKELDVQDSQAQGNRKQKEINLEQQISEIKGKLDGLMEEYSGTTKIVSKHSGRALEIKVSEGDEVSVGSDILAMERIDGRGGGLNIVFFVSAMDGKKIDNGMKLEISPSNVSSEEYGYLIGSVTNISRFPVSRQEIKRVLGSDDLVTLLTGRTVPFQVFGNLAQDASTPSGYRWSSKKGPPVNLHSGTVCTIGVTVDEQRPIFLVIPYLKEKLGL